MLFCSLFQGYAHDGHDGNSAQSAVDGIIVQNHSIARPPSDPAPPLPTMAYEQSTSRPDAREFSQNKVATAIGNVSKSDGPTSSVTEGSSVPVGQATTLNSVSRSVSLPTPVNGGISSSVSMTLASGITPVIAAAATSVTASESVSVFDLVSSDYSTHAEVFFLIAWSPVAVQQQEQLPLLLLLLTILNKATMFSSKNRFTRVVVQRGRRLYHLKLPRH